MTARYSFGGDEHIFVELNEAMSLGAFFGSISMAKAVRESRIRGVTEICPANASLQVRFDPDVIAPDALLGELQALEAASGRADKTLATRIVEIPVLYGDPWTHETLMRFRERHQDPGATDLEYAARINGYGGTDAFIAAHAAAPWFVTMVGFVAGLPFMYQMVERARQIEVPKYLRPRTDTPRLTVGHGGCFGCIYSVRGAGGYQMFGITPMPIYDPTQQAGYLREFMIFFRPGDIVKFRPIEREEYDAVVAELAAGRWAPTIRPAEFSLDAFEADPTGTNARLLETLHGH
jgi:urea carboxylase